MSFAGSITLLGCFVVATLHYWEQLFEREEKRDLRPFLAWLGKGTGFPLGLWILLNAGVSPAWPPLAPELQIVQATAGQTIAALFRVCGPAFFLIGSWWAAVTLGWMLVEIARMADHRGDFVGFAAFWSVIMVPLAGSIIWTGGWPVVGLALALWWLPIVHFTVPWLRKGAPLPMYAQAIGRMKLGKFAEAEAAVIAELEKKEDDFEGWMMLAEMYANHFNDLPHADQTVQDVCAQPNLAGVQISMAFLRLAEWHLKLAGDPVAARAALEEIMRRLPGTPFANEARHRIARLPASREELRRQRESKRIRLPALRMNPDDSETPAKPSLSKSDAAAIANDYVGKLQKDPNNVAAREQFAAILAENLGKVDLALDQLELLLAMPGQPEKKIAEWLSWKAAWLIKFRNDAESACKIFERLIQEHPQTTQAFAAQRRLKLMEFEQRLKRASSLAAAGAGQV